MKAHVSTMTIDHVTITELPDAVDPKHLKSLRSRFERYALERRLLHLIILPKGGTLQSQSAGLLEDIEHLIHTMGGEIGLVAWKPEMRRAMCVAGIDRRFKCFSSVSAGIDCLAHRDPNRV